MLDLRFAPSLSKPEADAQAKLLFALANTTRLRILNLLMAHEGLLCVDDLTAALPPLTQPTISHHLRAMREAGLIESGHSTYYTYYTVRRDVLRRAGAMLLALAAEGEAGK